MLKPKGAHEGPAGVGRKRVGSKGRSDLEKAKNVSKRRKARKLAKELRQQR